MVAARTKKTIWVSVDGSVRETAERPTLEQMQEWVGGYIERTVVKYEGVQCSMYVNEDGHALGLPPNARATNLLAIATHESSGVLMALLGATPHVVVGNAVLVIGWRNW